MVVIVIDVKNHASSVRNSSSFLLLVAATSAPLPRVYRGGSLIFQNDVESVDDSREVTFKLGVSLLFDSCLFLHCPDLGDLSMNLNRLNGTV